MKKFCLLLIFFGSTRVFAQTTPVTENGKSIYRAFATKSNDLVHTKLDASFDFAHSYMNGKAWISLKPHFYPTDSLVLDAKGMAIHNISLVKQGKNISLPFSYDSLQLHIALDKSYKRDETYTVYIEYTSRPNELKSQGSAAITDAKGLYFINPKGEDKTKPTQIWTQGETESNSVWLPTIDKPNQKTTQEFNLTVPAKYVSLSNGKLTAQKNNADGTRTDTWVMELPHAPYLLFMGIGDFAIVKDSYKGKEVNYYVDKPYEKVARKIFGNTPEMIAFYSDKVTGIEYPWPKYSQMVGTDYVSGAMENTTATLHQSSAQQDARELVDGNGWETTIAHELFHHWFGDLVTAESWSNLTVNESFANYSQTLWQEHKYGADEGAYENDKDMHTYLNSPGMRKDLVRFYYADKEDMFDPVTYEKGGRILHMLRNYVGDDAFFKSLNKYLTTYKFGNGNAQKLRLAFEEITGKDLNWFFNQWYFGNGHPVIDISYGYDATAGRAYVYLKQNQSGDKLFKLPIAIDVYQAQEKTRYQVWAENKADTFSFPVSAKPDLINVDGDKILLCQKKDNKSLAEYIYQYTHAAKYLDRKESIQYATSNLGKADAYQLLIQALNDPFYAIRSQALAGLSNAKLTEEAVAQIELLAKKDDHRTVRADAIDVLAKQHNKTYTDFFAAATRDSSYTVAGAALEALGSLDGKQAFDIANRLSKETHRGRLTSALGNIMLTYGDETAFDFIASSFKEMPLSQEKFNSVVTLAEVLEKVTDLAKFKTGIDLIIEFRDQIPQQERSQTDPIINNYVLKGLALKKKNTGAKEMADYINLKLPDGSKN